MDVEKSSLDNPSKGGQDTPKVERVVKGVVKTNKKSFGERLISLFAPGDPKAIAQDVLENTVAPAIKNAIQDTVEDALDSFLYPDGRRSGSSRRRSSNTPYSSISDGRSSVRSRAGNGGSRLLRARPVVEELIFETREDAYIVRDNMVRQIREYGCASVHDLYGYAGKTTDYTKEKWGWYGSIDGCEITHIREGWLLTMPDPVIIQ